MFTHTFGDALRAGNLNFEYCKSKILNLWQIMLARFFLNLVDWISIRDFFYAKNIIFVGILLAVKCDILQRKPSVEVQVSLNLASLEVREFIVFGSLLHLRIKLKYYWLFCNRYCRQQIYNTRSRLIWVFFVIFDTIYTGNFIGPRFVIRVTLPNQTLHRPPVDIFVCF